jgi:hypothetical protein
VIADVTYVGAVARDYHVNVDYPNVTAVVLSLSKPMGVYYHRIGGLLSQTEIPSLFGNQWFKNLLSLRYGTRLLQRFGVQELPQKYATVQERAAEKVSAQFNLPIKPADVMLIGNVPEHLFLESSPDMASYLTRPGVERNEPIRLCLTPGMAELIEPTAPHRRMAETSEHGMPGP